MDKVVLIELKGQIRGGKNHVMLTSSGHRYPNRIFAQWRNKAVLEVKQQFFERTFDVPCEVYVDYTPEDNRRRDVPALMDGVWHVLERAGVIKDDTLFKDVTWKTNKPGVPGLCKITIAAKKD